MTTISITQLSDSKPSKPGECYVYDQVVCLSTIEHPKTGMLFKPILGLLMDHGSRFVVSYALGEVNGDDLFFKTLHAATAFRCIPKTVCRDDGYIIDQKTLEILVGEKISICSHEPYQQRFKRVSERFLNGFEHLIKGISTYSEYMHYLGDYTNRYHNIAQEALNNRTPLSLFDEMEVAINANVMKVVIRH